MGRRVVITAIGLVTPLGLTPEATWSALIEGKSGLGPISAFDPKGLPTRVGGEVKGFRGRDYVDNVKNLKVMTHMVQLGIAAAKTAMDASRLLPDVDPERFGIAVGAGQASGDPQSLVAAIEASARADGSFDLEKFARDGIPAINPLWLLRGLSNNVLGFASAQFNAQGWNSNICNSGVSGLMAIGDAAVAIASDRADVILAGGYDALVSPEAIVRHARLGLLTASNDAGAKASRPFDARRDGFVPADGAAFVVLEAIEHAHRRGAVPIAEVMGYGVANDAWRLLDPAPQGGGIARAMKASLEDAALAPSDIRAVFAHGTSNPRYDRAETAAIKTALGEVAKRIPVPAIKGALGHPVAASGAIATAVAALALQERRVPKTLNLEERDPECDLDHAADQPRPLAAGSAVIVNSSGLGGQNASLVLRGFESKNDETQKIRKVSKDGTP